MDMRVHPRPTCATLLAPGSVYQRVVAPAVAKEDATHVDNLYTCPYVLRLKRPLKVPAAARRDWRDAFRAVLRSNDEQKVGLLQLIAGAVGFSSVTETSEESFEHVIAGLALAPSRAAALRETVADACKPKHP